MEFEDFIKDKSNMIDKGFELSQIREECWSFVLSKFNSTMRLDSIILMGMDLYGKVLIINKLNNKL